MKKIGLSITTYEIDNQGESTAVLTHIFWSKNLKGAMEIAKSHIITDNFFSGSFVGEMPWKDFVLHLENDIDVIGQKPNLNKLYNQLQKQAIKIHREKQKIGLIELITDLSNK